MNPEYTQNEDGSRSYTITLTAEQLASDQFLNDMKSGDALFKSWESQKSMIGKNTIPNADAGADAWASVYEKTRPANGYGLENADMEKLFSDNGLNKHQARIWLNRIYHLTKVPLRGESYNAINSCHTRYSIICNSICCRVYSGRYRGVGKIYQETKGRVA